MGIGDSLPCSLALWGLILSTFAFSDMFVSSLLIQIFDFLFMLLCFSKKQIINKRSFLAMWRSVQQDTINYSLSALIQHNKSFVLFLFTRNLLFRNFFTLKLVQNILIVFWWNCSLKQLISFKYFSLAQKHLLISLFSVVSLLRTSIRSSFCRLGLIFFSFFLVSKFSRRGPIYFNLCMICLLLSNESIPNHLARAWLTQQFKYNLVFKK